MNILDTMLTTLVPGVALRREQKRYDTGRLRAANKAIKAYDAGRIGRRFGGLNDKSTSANVEVLRSLPRMRNRHRALVRNNPWAGKAIEAIVTNTVGTGILGAIFTGVERSEELNELWLKWAETTACDVGGVSTLYGLQSLGLESTAEAGEVLVRRRWRRGDDGLPVPLQIELLEPDYLDHSKNQNLPGGGRIVQGIEFDTNARRVAYWLFKDHPGDSLMVFANSERVPAADVAHMYRQNRPQQVRGVPWGHKAIMTLHDLDGFEDAFLLRQKLANCFMGIETETDPIKGGDTDAGDDLEDLEPGVIYRPKAGRQLTFTNPPLAAGYDTYVVKVLLKIAAAYGISYQALTGDLTGVNFSSGRMGWLDFQRNIQKWRKNMLLPQFNERIGTWFLEAAVLAGARVPSDTRFEWTPPRREMIDPAKEIPPLRAAIRAGITSLPAVHREHGLHTDRVLAEIAATNKQLDDLDLILDSDPRKVSAAGLTQARAPGTVIPDDPDDD